MRETPDPEPIGPPRAGRWRRRSAQWATVLVLLAVVLLLAEGFQGFTVRTGSVAPSASSSSTPTASAPTSASALAAPPAKPAAAVHGFAAASAAPTSPAQPGYRALCLIEVLPQCARSEAPGTSDPVPLGPDPPASWTNITPPSGQPNPGGRYLSSMAYDPATHDVLLFGGYGELGTGPWVFYQDTWAFSAGHWSELIANTSCTPSTCPSPRAGAMLAYDPVDQGMLLFGGYTYTPSITIISYSDTWLFSNGAWTNVSATAGTPPYPRYDASMVWDSYDNYVLLYGGVINSTHMAGDTWKFVAGAWTNITSTVGYSPSPRGGAAIADSPSGWIMLFGGMNDLGELYTDAGGCGDSVVAWWFYGGQWEQMALSPPCITSPSQPVPLSSVTGTYPPCGRVDAALGWSPPNNHFVLFGGIGPADEAACSGFDGFLNDTWTYENTPGAGFFFQNATDPGYVGDPELREEMGYAADFTDNYFMIFGGWGGYGPGFNDTWRFNELVHAKLTGPSTIDTNSSHLSFNVPFTVTGFGGSGFLNYKFTIQGLKTGNTLQDAAGSTGCGNFTNPSGNFSLPYDGIANVFCDPTPQSYNTYKLTVTVFDIHNASAHASASWTFSVLPPESIIIYSELAGFFYTNLSVDNNFSAYLKVADEPAVSVSATLGGLPVGFEQRSANSFWWDIASPVDMGTLFPGSTLEITAEFGSPTPDWTLNATYSIKMIWTPVWLSTIVNLPGTIPTLKSSGSGQYNKSYTISDVYNWNIAKAFGFDLPIPLIGGNYSLIPGVTLTASLTSAGNVSLNGTYQFNSTQISIGPASIKITASISLIGTFALVQRGVNIDGINWVSATVKLTVAGDLSVSVPIYGFNILGVQVGFTLNIEVQPSISLLLVLIPTTDVPEEIIPGLEVTLGYLLGSFTLPLSVSVSFGIGVASVAIGGTVSVALTFDLYPTLSLADGWVNGTIFISASALWWSDQWNLLGPAVIYSWTDPPSLPADPGGSVSSLLPGYDNGSGTTWQVDSRYYASSGYDQNVWNLNLSGGAAISDIYPHTEVSAAPGYDGAYLYYTNDNVQVPVNQGLEISSDRLNASTNSFTAAPAPTDSGYLISGPEATTLANGTQFVAWSALPASEENLANPTLLTSLGVHGAFFSPATQTWSSVRDFANWGVAESYQVDATSTGGVLLALIAPTFLIGSTTPERLIAFNIATGAVLSNTSVVGISSIKSLRAPIGDAVLQPASGNATVVGYAADTPVPISVTEPANTSLSSASFVAGVPSTVLLVYRQPSATDIVLYNLSSASVIASTRGAPDLVDAKGIFGAGEYYLFARSAKAIFGWTEEGGLFHALSAYPVAHLQSFGLVQAGSGIVVYAISTNGNMTTPIAALDLEEISAALPTVPGRPVVSTPPPKHTPPSGNSTTNTTVTTPSVNTALYLEYLAIAGAAVGVLLAVTFIATRKPPRTESASEGPPPEPPPPPPEAPP